MRDSLRREQENPNGIAEKGFGFGPIHYLIDKNHGNRRDLLLCLAIDGKADLDLTTTELRQITALHMACKVLARACRACNYNVVSLDPRALERGPGIHCLRMCGVYSKSVSKIHCILSLAKSSNDF